MIGRLGVDRTRAAAEWLARTPTGRGAGCLSGGWSRGRPREASEGAVGREQPSMRRQAAARRLRARETSARHEQRSSSCHS